MSTSNSSKALRIAGFHLLGEIARGGMGSVYRAYQVSIDRTVAVKLLAPKLAEDEAFVKRFLREARAAARLNHPNIVQAIDAGESEGCCYFAMEFERYDRVPAHTAEEIIERRKGQDKG